MYFASTFNSTDRMTSNELPSSTLHSRRPYNGVNRISRIHTDKTHLISDVASRNACLGQICYSRQLTAEIAGQTKRISTRLFPTVSGDSSLKLFSSPSCFRFVTSGTFCLAHEKYSHHSLRLFARGSLFSYCFSYTRHKQSTKWARRRPSQKRSLRFATTMSYPLFTSFERK